MTNISTPISDLPPEQRAIRDKCFHTTGKFIEFKKEEIEQSIPDRFEQQVAKYPDRLAVKTKSDTFTYDQLNKAANRVAHAILAQGRGGEEPIVLLLEHGAAMIAGILGVLKAGKIYVPLDASCPLSRLRYILGDSQAGLVVTDNQSISLAKELGNSPQVLNVGEFDATVVHENPGLSIPPERLTYIIYTSGSTGQPKGVVQNHLNVLHLIMRYTNRAHIIASDRIGLVKSFSVNGGTLHTLGALLNGAAILPFDLKQEGIGKLAKWLSQEEITVCSLSPTTFRQLVASQSEDTSIYKLRTIHFSGEPLRKRDVDLCREYFSPACITNSLGSTEASYACQYIIGKDTKIRNEVVPCGYATEDMKVLLLDNDSKELRINRVGEIAIKSRYLSPGYWRRPDLTKAKFLPDPEGGEERIYLSGDLGRALADGCLELVGRKDFQVKVRGYRIEVEEIELALLALDAVKEAVVVARGDVPGNKRLVAYIAPAIKPAPTISALRRGLAEKLPDYMIPSAFVLLDTLPLTPTGKVDRKALPVPHGSRPELDNSYLAPRTPVEKELAQIWAEVLGLDQVGIHDSFFDLGGHSLLATQAISRVINAFKVELPIKSLFESPTVANMAVVITENMAKNAGDEELARMLAELESISDEEARKQLADEETKEASEK